MVSNGAVARRQKARGEMREVILEAAKALIAKDGVDALSMRAIAREIGYSPAALYEYFPSKERICSAIYFEGGEGLAAQMRTALESAPSGTTPDEKMRLLGTAYRRYALEHRDLYRHIFSEIPYAPQEDASDPRNDSIRLLIATAREGVEQGVFINVPPEAIAVACWAAIHGLVLLENNNRIDHKLGTIKDGTLYDFNFFDSTLLILGAGFMRRE